jgi:ribosomal protein S18 acetylase RimI-like enzyme
MKTAIETVRLQESSINAVAEVLARAFFDDPLTIYVEPNESRRAQVLPVLYEVGTRYAHLFGEAYTTAGHIEGAALWIAPDSGDFTTDRMAAAGSGTSSAALGPEAFGRFMKLMTHMDGLRATAMPSPHWYLTILGVEPSRQGMGIGSQLIQPVLKRADATGLDCYLETMKTGNLVFYKQHGFEVGAEGNLPNNGPYYWTMRRRARRRDSRSG